MPPESRSLASLQTTGPFSFVPAATYRLQLGCHFTFQQAGEIAEYLRQLGISACYFSPIFRAQSESAHGYDVCDYNQLSPDLGGESGFDALSGLLRRHQLGLVLDMVPNHMGTGDPANQWWGDLLEKGASSRFSRWFDVDWRPLTPGLENKILLPILGGHYFQALEGGELKVELQQGQLGLSYYQTQLPVSPESVKWLLQSFAESGGVNLDGKWMEELFELLDQKDDGWKALLSRRTREDARFTTALEQWLQQFNGSPGWLESFQELHCFLELQHYRLAFWRTGPYEINYRRFFDITALAALRMELPEVFQETHELLFQLIQQGKINGLRIDHPDGLWDPEEYFSRLQEQYARITAAGKNESVSAAFLAPPGGLFILAEKILCEGESLPSRWPIHGTTGYDFLNVCNGLFVDPGNEEVFTELYARFTGNRAFFEQIAWSAKKQVIESAFPGDLDDLASRARRLAALSLHGRDFTSSQLRQGLLELMAAFPVYRTYINPRNSPNAEHDQRYVSEALESASRFNPDLQTGLLEFLANLLLLQDLELLQEAREENIHFIMRFQQISGPVMAKGVEDTAFYRYCRLVSLNEVGGHPGKFGFTPEEFHQHNQSRQSYWPDSMLALATHDTKRGEDLRARLNVLSEFPEQWGQAVEEWRKLNTPFKTSLPSGPAPSPNDEYLLYQTLVGAWPHGAERLSDAPDFSDRISAYMLKAIKEAKVESSWTVPSQAYEEAVERFIRAILESHHAERFLSNLLSFQKLIVLPGAINSLAQTLLKITAPGLPDFYQGTELWDLSLVDPDNRRPVDYQQRRHILDQFKTVLAGENVPPAIWNELLESWHDGRIKMLLVALALNYRSRNHLLFARGQYHPISASGAKAKHLFAFARSWQDRTVVVAAPRLSGQLCQGGEQWPLDGVWQNTSLDLASIGLDGALFRNVFTGDELRIHENKIQAPQLFHHLPAALLERSGP